MDRTITLLKPTVKLLPKDEVKKEMELVEDSYPLLKDDRFSFILNIYNDSDDIEEYSLKLDTSLDYKVEELEYVPVFLPHKSPHDDSYISHDIGLYPDLLIPYEGFIRIMPGTNRSLWISVFTGSNTGRRQLDINVEAYDEKVFSRSLSLDMISTTLSTDTPEHTEWLHQDSLLYYYNEKAWTERHWEIIDNYVEFAASRCGINTILTPIFTPPIDTAVGKERMTVQLIDITLKDNTYSFDFSRLERWCKILRSHGIRNVELPHFFTQWGATATPKIMVKENGELKRRFGWDTSSDNTGYWKFLSALIPETLRALSDFGYDKDHVILHVSDEPGKEHQENYGKVSTLIERLADGARVIDALSNVEYYESSLVKIPVVSNNHIEPFWEKRKGELWTYYCVSQGKDVPNRFIAMPSIRNRIMGTLLYYFNLSGFLHWGFNFYLSQFSRRFLNPYSITDSYRAFTAGDPYLVYPGQNLKPLSSLRNEVQMDAITDYRRLKTLEDLIGRQKVMALIEETFGYRPSFRKYPMDDDILFSLNRKVTELIMVTNKKK